MIFSRTSCVCYAHRKQATPNTNNKSWAGLSQPTLQSRASPPIHWSCFLNRWIKQQRKIVGQEYERRHVQILGSGTHATSYWSAASQDQEQWRVEEQQTTDYLYSVELFCKAWQWWYLVWRRMVRMMELVFWGLVVASLSDDFDAVSFAFTFARSANCEVWDDLK